jgi:hypothetical protein
MNVQISGGQILVNVEELLKSIPTADRLKLAEILACDAEVLKFVTQQILDGQTENGYYSAICCTAHSDTGPCGGLDWAVREVAKRSGETAAREIKRLEDALKHREENIRMLQTELNRSRRDSDCCRNDPDFSGLF